LNVKKVIREKLYQGENPERNQTTSNFLSSSGCFSEPHSTNSTKPNQWLLTNLRAQQLWGCQRL